MKIAVVIPYFFPAYVYGGAVFAAYHLSREISNLEIDVKVLTTNANGDEKLKFTPNTFTSLDNLQVKYYDKGFLPFFSLKMIFGFYKDLKNVDLVHIQSIYSLTTPLSLLYAYFLNKPILLSPRGSLTSWSFNHRGFLKKIWIRLLIQSFKKRIYWHATSKREELEIKVFFPKAKIKLISDGTSLSQKTEYLQINRWENEYFIACLGRLHSVKGFDILISAMPIILEKYPSLKLFIAGNDEGEQAKLEKLISNLNLNQQIKIVGSLDLKDKNAFLKNAQCLVMPSHTENFGIVAVEALLQSTPVIASKNTPWEILEKEMVGLHVENSRNELAKAVITILKDVKSYQKNTQKVVQIFSWKSIALKYKMVLEELINQSKTP